METNEPGCGKGFFNKEGRRGAGQKIVQTWNSISTQSFSMKQSKQLLNRIAKTAPIAFYILLMVVVCGAGCVSSTPRPDPLAGWHLRFSQDPNGLDNSIKDDYHNYIQELPSKERKFVGIVYLLEDGTGQHAIKIEIPLNHVWREHVLIYDKDNKRIKVIKYAGGRYAC